MSDIEITDERQACWTPKTLAKFLRVSERYARDLMGPNGPIRSFTVGTARRALDEDVQRYIQALKGDE